jgi:nitrite reductase/ring-hydroxylating ferredoxin subunit
MQELVELDRLIRKGKMRVLYKNRRILLVYLDEKVYAIDDKCPHMGSSLFPGKIEDEIIFCKDHGLGISLKTGEVASAKQADFMRLDEYSRSVKKYQVEVKDGKVYIK